MNEHIAEPFKSICNSFYRACPSRNHMVEDKEESDWERREKHLEEIMDKEKD